MQNNQRRHETTTTSSSSTIHNIMCICGTEAREKTSQSERNPGRVFYSCTQSVCDFFLWKDQQDPESSSANTTTNPPPPPQCLCPQEAALRTAQSAKNPGRTFYCCAKPREQQCTFFHWTDERPPESRTSSSNTVPPPLPPSCDCHQAATYRISRSAANPERPFFACAKDAAQRCSFFQWADTNNENQHALPLFQPPQGQEAGHPTNNNNAVLCHCDTPAVERKVQKQGPNQGKGFLCCAKSQTDNRCNFFLWT